MKFLLIFFLQFFPFSFYVISSRRLSGLKENEDRVTVPQITQFSSAVQSCPTICDPIDCSTTGFLSITNSWSLLKLMSITSVMPSNHLMLCRPFSSCLQPFPASGSFPMSQFFASGGKSIGASASSSLLAMDTQDWFPLGLTGLISLQSKGLSRVFSNTTVQKHQLFSVRLSL